MLKEETLSVKRPHANTFPGWQPLRVAQWAQKTPKQVEGNPSSNKGLRAALQIKGDASAPYTADRVTRHLASM